jgi:hypothetical protein
MLSFASLMLLNVIDRDKRSHLDAYGKGAHRRAA